MTKWVPIFLLLFSISSQASLEVIDIDRVSNWEEANTETNETSTPIVYMGWAGPECTGLDDSTLCDSCTSNTTTASLYPCNRKRGHSNLNLLIQFRVTSGDADASGTPMIADNEDGTSIASGGSSGVSKGSDTEIEVNWNSLCSAILGGDCENYTGESKTVRVGIDYNSSGSLESSDEYGTVTIRVQTPDSVSDGTTELCGDPSAQGICDFEAFPGDNKFYFKNPAADSDDEDLDIQNLVAGIGVYSIRIFASPNEFSNTTPGMTKTDDIIYDLKVDSDGEFNNKISELDNETPYYVRVGLVDKAMNLVFITSDTAILNKCGKTVGSYVPGDDATCDYMVTPDNVVGLLSEDINCFITTAAYGTHLDKRISTFRDFRNNVLLQSNFGKKLVLYYYNVGPKAARFIEQSPTLRAITQFFLWPLWLFAWLSLKFGALNATLLSATALVLPILGFKVYRNYLNNMRLAKEEWQNT